MSRALLILDCENLFKSAKILYGDIHINYRKITDLMLLRLSHVVDDDLSNIEVCKLAFTSLKPDQNTQMDFLCFLSSLGYEVKSSISSLEENTGILRKQDDYFSWIYESTVNSSFYVDSIPGYAMIACGSSKLKPLYHHLGRVNTVVEIFGFEGSVSTHVYMPRHILDKGFLL